MDGQVAAPSQLNRRFDRYDMPNLGKHNMQGRHFMSREKKN
jgi:hypothetical protein